jgi:hypothetical protein
MNKPDPESVRRRLLIAALGATVAGTLPASLRAQGLFGSRPQPLPPGQSFYRITGEVTVDGQPATLATTVRPGSTVETRAASEAIFAVGTHAMLLRASSRLVIEAAAAPIESSAPAISGLRLLGKLLSVSRDSPMRVQTATATIGIRGTGWYAEADPELTYFCTCYGEVDVVANEDPASRESVLSKQHDRPLFIARADAPGALIRAAPFIDHTDQELALIEAIVGREPPFVFPRDIYNTPRRTY